jgi:signal transduction histidine kinase
VVDDDALRALAEMPRVRPETAERLATHFRKVVDLLLFSSHRAHLTSEMHVASVREGYRELAEKTANLQQAYDRLKELDKLKSNFLATVSHELRTPLTSIIGYSEMLEAGIAGDLAEEQREFVETIRRKGDHLLALITSLLDLSKLEQGALRLTREALAPRALLDEIAATFLPQARKKNVTISVEAAEDLPPVDGDPVRLRQVLSNLADNAMKFTPKGGSISLRAVQTDLVGGEDGEMGMVLMAAARPAIRFEICDTGPGMKQEELPHIFDAFYQVDGSSTREHGGAGLGLSIVKRLVDAHEGEVHVSSEVDVGTTFSVTLPAVEADL